MNKTASNDGFVPKASRSIQRRDEMNEWQASGTVLGRLIWPEPPGDFARRNKAMLAPMANIVSVNMTRSKS